MKITEYSGVLFCDACAEHATSLARAGMVGGGTVFEHCCPHVEVKFLEWRRLQRADEPKPFTTFMLGLGLGVSLSAFLVSVFA